MTTEQKEEYLSKAKLILNSKSRAISSEIERIPAESMKLNELKYGSAEDQLTYQTMLATYRRRFNDLQNLYPSPYFYYCLVKFDGEDDFRELYFSKFSFDNESIYSWASPVSQIRFESPGRFVFETNGNKQSGFMIKKDQYLINENKIIFLATENGDNPRELIYQEYFSTRKTAFVLPEIVAQMEKAQDQVVRASFGGLLAVTGPAGSGKTTLALHRIAYLLQAPEMSEKLSDKDILVFVQDESTRDYFSHLLPDLGIKDVEITTLASWAKRILPLAGWEIVEHEKDSDASYVWAKITALRDGNKATWRNDWFNILNDKYGKQFNGEQSVRLSAQKKNKVLDRIDLAILLSAKYEADGFFNIEKEYYTVAKDMELKKKTGRFKASYKLMIIDEFQNYLSEQLDLFGRAVNEIDGESVYIGDFNQRVRLGTSLNTESLGQNFSAERLVKLSKVYRNTKEILLYLQGLRYKVNIPEMIKSGPEAKELAFSQAEEAQYIADQIENLKEVSVGILSHNEKTVNFYKERFKEYKNVKAMSLTDSQGVEFDTVFLAGVDDDLLSVKHLPQELQGEMAKIKRDLLYIALTRAMNGLHVLGERKLSDIIKV
ncbi:MAG: UvrD-helicase domain-containing protein [Candidatus Buchananbacteria bacterium]